MIASINVLSKFEEDPIASNSLMESIFTVDKKLREVQSATFKSLKNVKPKNKVLALIDIYERSRAAFYSTATMVSNTLGNMDDDEVIPVLIFISKDLSLDIKVRNRAIEILASNKNDTRVIEMFTEMLTEPSTQNQLKDFAINTMKDVKEERLILALMDTYNQGQASYYSLLGTLLDALGNFNDPVILPTLIQIAMDNDIPRNLRVKSINGLGNFKNSNTCLLSCVHIIASSLKESILRSNKVSDMFPVHLLNHVLTYWDNCSLVSSPGIHQRVGLYFNRSQPGGSSGVSSRYKTSHPGNSLS